jgi:putative ABC transport system permease protein
MAGAIWRKLRADIKTHKLQFLLVFGVLALSAMLLTISLLLLGSTDEPWDSTFEDTNGPHVWVTSAQHDIDFSPIIEDAAVTETTGAILALAENPIVIDDEKIPFFIYVMEERPTVASPLLADGNWLEAENPDEIVLDYSFANYFDIQVGDKVTFLGGNGTQNLRVVGLAVTAHWFPFNEITKDVSPGVAYISAQTFRVLQPDPEFWYATIGLRLHNPEDSKDFANKVFETLSGSLVNVIEWQYVKQNATLANTINLSFISMFSFLGLVSVGFIIFNTIGGQVLSQYREIGLLKAVGFKPLQVTLLLLGEHLFIGLLAALAGIIFGLLLAPGFVNPFAENLNTPPPNIYAPGPLMAVLFIVEVTVTIATLLPAWQGGRIDTVQAIIAGYQKRYRRISRMAQLAGLLRLPVAVVMGVKDTFSRPIRALLAIAALALTVTIAVTSVSAQATAEHLGQSRMYSLGTSADMKVVRNFVPHEIIQDEILTRAEVREFYTELSLLGQVPGHSDQPIAFRVLSADYQGFDFQLKEGEMFTSPGEAVAGYAFLDLLDIQVGDTVDLFVEGEPVHLKIVGRHTEAYMNNNVIIISMDTYREQVGATAEPQIYYLRLQDYETAEDLRSTLLDEFEGLIDVNVITEQPLSSMVQLVNLITGLGLIMLIVASANLMSNSLLGIRERMRDIGIQKAMGLTPAQIGRSVVVGTVTITVLALLIGVPAGIWFMGKFVSQIGIEIGAGPDFYIIHWGWIATLIPILVLLAIGSSLLPAYRAARLQVIDALRYE